MGLGLHRRTGTRWSLGGRFGDLRICKATLDPYGDANKLAAKYIPYDRSPLGEDI